MVICYSKTTGSTKDWLILVQHILTHIQVNHILRELEEEYRANILARLAALGRDIPPGVDPLDLSTDPDLGFELSSSDAGSDSSDSDGPPVHLLAKSTTKGTTFCVNV